MPSRSHQLTPTPIKSALIIINFLTRTANKESHFELHRSQGAPEDQGLPGQAAASLSFLPTKADQCMHACVCTAGLPASAHTPMRLATLVHVQGRHTAQAAFLRAAAAVGGGCHPAANTPCTTCMPEMCCCASPRRGLPPGAAAPQLGGCGCWPQARRRRPACCSHSKARCYPTHPIHITQWSQPHRWSPQRHPQMRGSPWAPSPPPLHKMHSERERHVTVHLAPWDLVQSRGLPTRAVLLRGICPLVHHPTPHPHPCLPACLAG